jgi:hypothetical protein
MLKVGLGRVLSNLLKIPSPYFMILMGGFETGMLGYSIFISLYGTGIPPDRGSDQGACVSLILTLLLERVAERACGST